jgi:hypothetical protein
MPYYYGIHRCRSAYLCKCLVWRAQLRQMWHTAWNHCKSAYLAIISVCHLIYVFYNWKIVGKYPGGRFKAPLGHPAMCVSLMGQGEYRFATVGKNSWPGWSIYSYIWRFCFLYRQNRECWMRNSISDRVDYTPRPISETGPWTIMGNFTVKAT